MHHFWRGEDAAVSQPTAQREAVARSGPSSGVGKDSGLAKQLRSFGRFLIAALWAISLEQGVVRKSDIRFQTK
jgi:hypothetical protein